MTKTQVDLNGYQKNDREENFSLRLFVPRAEADEPPNNSSTLLDFLEPDDISSRLDASVLVHSTT